MASSSRPPWEKKSKGGSTARTSLRPPWERQGDTSQDNEQEETCSFDSGLDFGFLNESLAEVSKIPASFHHFQQLPLELRENIFELSLPEQRILRLRVTGNGQTHHCRYDRRNDLGNIVSDANYHVRLESTGINSPLLYTNHEARRVLNRVYRVCIPILPRYFSVEASSPSPAANTPYYAPSRLLFCPERDTISICFDDKEDEPHFANFMHDALAYDPQQKGVLHMAVMSRVGFRGVNLPTGYADLHSNAQVALASILRGLESVRLVHLNQKPRSMFSTLTSNFPVPLEDLEIPKDLVRFNRAYPLWSSNASYSILPTDPRPVSRYLDLVDCGWDPRCLIRAWRTFEAACNVPPTASDKIRVLIAFTNDLEFATISQTRRFRHREELSMNARWEKGGYYNDNYPEWKNPDTEEDHEFSKKQNAIGFWSVPLDAFGPVPEVPYETHRWQMSRVCNFTNVEGQIQLGLFHITQRE